VATVEPITRGVNVGVDIGQKVDPTAIVVAEVQLRNYELSTYGVPRGGECHFAIRTIERLPLDTPYPTVVSRLVEIKNNLEQRNIQRVDFWIDATGVGQPVVDLLKDKGLRVRAVYLTGSDKAEHGQYEHEWSIGKLVLINRLKVLQQTGRLHVPNSAETQTLLNELANYEIKYTDCGHVQFGGRTGIHDDLVIALGLACWQEPTRLQIF
jgi:hypothetical protein